MSKPTESQPTEERTLDNKSLRTIEAILRTSFDPHAKLTLITMAMDLNTKREDWAVWRGRPSMSKRTSLGLDVLSKIRAYVIKEGVLSERKEPHPLQIRKAKKAKGFAGRPASCYDFDIDHLEALGTDAAQISLRNSRAKKRLQDRQDKTRERIMTIDHGLALREDLARTIRQIRARYPIVGKNQRPRYDVCLGEVEAATLSLILRDPEQFARGFKHGYLIRKAERHRAREEA